MEKSIIGSYENVEIKVIKTATETQLFVDHKLVANKKALIDPIFSKPVIEYIYSFPTGSKTIQVCIGAALTGNKIKILVSGTLVAQGKTILI
jgi:hypothetical protein